MDRTATLGEQSVASMIEIPCRVDYRPTNAQQFCEWTGRVARLSATECRIVAAHVPQPGAWRELRIYLRGHAWPIKVPQAEVGWSHWRDFTVGFLHFSRQEQDQLEGSLRAASVLVAN